MLNGNNFYISVVGLMAENPHKWELARIRNQFKMSRVPFDKVIPRSFKYINTTERMSIDHYWASMTKDIYRCCFTH